MASVEEAQEVLKELGMARPQHNRMAGLTLLALCRLRVGLVFVTAFPDAAEFRKHMSAIAWETEVWMADQPDHVVHYDGDRFLGPRR